MVVLPPWATLPMPHVVQAVHMVSPSVGAKKPVVHGVHAVAPELAEIEPATHAVHVAELVEFGALNEPASHDPQPRSRLAVGVTVTCWPPPQFVSGRQLVWFVWFW